MQQQIMVIDPASSWPELDCFNKISMLSELPCSYHAPALFGFDSMTLSQADAPVAGVIVFGSGAHVSDHPPWQSTLWQFLSNWIDAAVPVLGLCYGHQLLSTQFGGELARLDHKQKGYREIQYQADPRLGTQSHRGKAVVSHIEYVKTLPSGFEGFAHSEGFSFDGIRHQQLPIWGFQPHIEAHLGFCRNNGICQELKELGLTTDDLMYGQTLIGKFIHFCRDRKILISS